MAGNAYSNTALNQSIAIDAMQAVQEDWGMHRMQQGKVQRRRHGGWARDGPLG